MPTLERETVEIVRDLIRIETVNTGEPDTIGDGEARAARYVRERLAEVGVYGEYVETTAGRGNLVVRIPGRDRSAGALLAHAHLDVVPVDAAAWSVPPFAAEVRDDVLYGRGAVDMKGFAGTLVAVARELARTDTVPRRDVVLAFFADEEAGGVWGARWLAEHRPELFDGVTEAIGEVGGFSVALPASTGGPRRAYLLAAAEKGPGRALLRARGPAGHASRPTTDNAVVRLARAVAALGAHPFPVQRTDATAGFLSLLADLTDGDLGMVGEIAAAGLRHSATPTMLAAGYKLNVVPGEAVAEVDVRVLPGDEAGFRRTVEEVVGADATVEWAETMAPTAAPLDGPLVETVRAAVAAEDPDGRVLPYLLAASTDSKNLSRLGIACYGFTPLPVPDGFDAFGQFHAVDERVPLSALRSGARLTERILRTA